ncbi:MAG: hypothetical protein RL757_2118 [Bacteroidota bacterium]|jgi:cytochrome c oxidase subunit IV
MDYQEGLKTVRFGLILLGVITVAEVLFALVGNGHIIEGVTFPKWLMYPAMIGASLYKAYFIIYKFMHMGHEVSGLAKTVLMPMLLLVWALIAFFWEGDAWLGNREKVENRDARTIEPAKPKVGDILDLSKVRNLG